MKVFIAALLVLILPIVARASEQAQGIVEASFASSAYGYLGLFLFVLAYSIVPLENKIHLRKIKTEICRGLSSFLRTIPKAPALPCISI